jgi:tRNA-specific 2-thiouridylase
MKKRVVAAMSGGVDSAVAAYLLKEEGFEVIGITLRLAPESPGEKREGRCCSIDDMHDARRVCEKLDIPFYAIDAREKFKETVFDPFVRAYEQGITPIPCLACNHTVKFGDLFQSAEKLNADLATGHYVQRLSYKGTETLARPEDLARDQTYYLYGTKSEIIPSLRFPLGKIAKPEVRAIAQKIGLLVHDKKDSHEICFVPDGNHAKVVEKALGKDFSSGNILNEKGQIIGQHKGIHHYTIGQRRGLGLASSNRQFVADINSEDQSVVLAPKSALMVTKIAVSAFNYLVPAELWPTTVSIKIRARSEAAAAVVAGLDEKSRLSFTFAAPQAAVALGQAAVVYDGEAVLGGGILSARLDGAFPRQIPCRDVLNS